MLVFPRHLLVQAAATLLGKSAQGLEGSKLKTKVRRLYDIANILSSLHLIEKVQTTSRKPAFKWLGPSTASLNSAATTGRPMSRFSLKRDPDTRSSVKAQTPSAKRRKVGIFYARISRVHLGCSWPFDCAHKYAPALVTISQSTCSQLRVQAPSI